MLGRKSDLDECGRVGVVSENVCVTAQLPLAGATGQSDHVSSESRDSLKYAIAYDNQLIPMYVFPSQGQKPQIQPHLQANQENVQKC